MTIPLEHVDTTTPIGRNFELLARWVIDTAGRLAGVRFGKQVLTWNSSPAADNVTVSHGLARTPVTVLVTAGHPSVSMTTAGAVDTVGATTFVLGARTTDGSTPVAGATRDFYWLVIG